MDDFITWNEKSFMHEIDSGLMEIGDLLHSYIQQEGNLQPVRSDFFNFWPN